jgi:hypothetical protein
MHRNGLCHPHQLQQQHHQTQEFERCRCCSTAVTAAASSNNLTGFQLLNPNATGVSELLELATEV